MLSSLASIKTTLSSANSRWVIVGPFLPKLTPDSCLSSILGKYEVSSGQRVNLQKSSIYFERGRTEQQRGVLKNIIGIESEALSEKYLGLPTSVGQSKNGAFKNLTDCSRGKVGGWKGQGLSKAG
jgi:hypothetical protein